ARKVYGAHIHNLIADANTVAAENAFAQISCDRCRGIVDLRLCLGVFKSDMAYAVAAGQLLELTCAVLIAGGAVAAVGREQELQYHFSVFSDLGSVGVYLHAVSRHRGAGGLNVSPLVFDDAHAAGAVGRKLRVVAEG